MQSPSAFRRRVRWWLPSLALVGVLVAVGVVVVWHTYQSVGRDPHPFEATRAIATVRADLLRATTGAGWRAVEERDAACNDSSPAQMELDVRTLGHGDVASATAALRRNGWAPNGLALDKRFGHVQASVRIDPSGASMVTLTASVSITNVLADDYCSEPESPAATFRPTSSP
jgi:hypothetical protein